MLRHRVDRVQPLGIFWSIGPRRVCIQHGNNRSTHLHRQSGCISRTIGPGEGGQACSVAISVLLTCARTHDLPYNSRLSRIEIGTNDRLASRETQRAPAAQLFPIDEKYGGALRFLTGRLDELLENVAERRRFVERAQCRREPGGLCKPPPQPFCFALRTLGLETRLLEILSMPFKALIAFVELTPALLQLLPASIDILQMLVNLTLKRCVRALQVFEIAPSHAQLVAPFVERSLQSGDLRRRTSLQFLSLTREFFSLPGKLFSLSSKPFAFSSKPFAFSSKLFADECELLLRLTPHRRFRPFSCLDEGPAMFVGYSTQDVGSRCAQIGFNLSAEAHADTVERRTDVIVERR